MQVFEGTFWGITLTNHALFRVKKDVYDKAEKWNVKRWISDSRQRHIELCLNPADKKDAAAKFSDFYWEKVHVQAQCKEFTSSDGRFVKYCVLNNMRLLNVINVTVADSDSDDSDEDLTEIEKQFKKLRQKEEEELQKQVDSLGK